jgi:TolB-like protein
MSPEQIAGRTVDHRTDIFSLGILLYQMASGQRPFAGTSSFELASAILRDTPPAVTTVRTGLPADFDRLVRRCLEKDPRDRIQTAREVAKECRELGQQASQATPAPAGRSTATGSGLTQVMPSIAVLPFANMSADKEHEYFSDGLTEEVINALVKVPGLKVIARTSVFAFKHQHTDIRKIAEVLGVTNIIEGSVRRAGNRIRVTAQLIVAADGTHLWSERTTARWRICSRYRTTSPRPSRRSCG